MHYVVLAIFICGVVLIAMYAQNLRNVLVIGAVWGVLATLMSFVFADFPYLSSRSFMMSMLYGAIGGLVCAAIGYGIITIVRTVKTRNR